MRKRSVIAAVTLCLVACAGAGPYNFSKNYEPLSEEDEHAERAVKASYEDVRRDPHGFADRTVSWFGVVTGYGELSKGRVRLVLSHRLHQARHLCKTESDDSCRVTVSDKSMGDFTVDLDLTPEQRMGKEKVWFGSLMRVYATASGEYDANGNPIMKVAYYRHWPRGYYVTVSARSFMRR